MTEFLAQFIPGPKALAVILASAFLALEPKLGLNIPKEKVYAGAFLVACYIVSHIKKPAQAAAAATVSASAGHAGEGIK